MKKFHKTVTPPCCFYEILIQKFDRISEFFFFLDPNTHVYCDVKQYMYQTFLSLAVFINPYTH